MGNSNGKHKGLQRRFTGKLHHIETGAGFARYNDKELTLLDRMFQDLAKRSPDETMSKETFLQYFALPGILGERLFAVFDAKKNGVIDFEEFVNGLARYNRGSLQEKIEMLFEMYDMDGLQQVKPEELSLILYSVITPTTSLFYGATSTKGLKVHGDGTISHVSKLTRQTVEKMVSDAFEHCDTNKDGLLSQPQFSNWVKQNPGALQLLETVFAKHVWSGWDETMDPNGLQSAEQIDSPTTGASSEDIEDEQKQKQTSKQIIHNSNPTSPRAATGLSIMNNHSNKLSAIKPRLKADKLSLNGHGSHSHIHRSLSAISAMSGLQSSPNHLVSVKSVTKFEQPTQSMPAHFNSLYDKLTQIYLEEGDEHKVHICGDCEYKYYTSIHIEEPLNENNKELNYYNQFVIFNKKNFKENERLGALDIRYCPQCGNRLEIATTSSVSEIMNLGTAATLLPSVSTATLNEVGRKGTLYKIGAKFKSFISRYYVIKEKFLYTFKKQNDRFPINVVFIAGWYINGINDSHLDKGWYGIEMTAPSVDDGVEQTASIARTTHKILYSKSSRDRDDWVRCLQKAAATIAIKQHYKITRTLGKGHFSVVHLGINRQTGKECAVKIVEKSRIDARERMSLRNEIAMMRLVNHPCIIRMLDVFEDKKCIYMVMTLAPYGDFFARWKKRKIFDEDVARIIIWKLLDATQYLHALGIVHRDLKPENILCLDENDDTMIVISDFGLSKFAAPHTEMTMPCGTLAYVAPEVLSMKGYGRKVDLWSLGCIMHLLLRGVLPFDGRTKDEVVEKTLNKKLNLTHQKWNKVSVQAKDLISKLLIKDPRDRISLNQALDHVWFDKIKHDKQYSHQKDISPTIHAVMSGADDTPLPTPIACFQLLSENVNENENDNDNINDSAMNGCH